jgi:hypothetical protein
MKMRQIQSFGSLGQLCRYGNIVLVIGWNSFGNGVCLKPPMNDDDEENRPEETERVVNKGCSNPVLFVLYIVYRAFQSGFPRSSAESRFGSSSKDENAQKVR